MPDIRFQEILESVVSIPGYTVAPFDLTVFLATRGLSSDLQIHDRIIGATAQTYAAPIMTRDGQLREHVQTV
jgi:hypothetical protein